MKPLYVIAMICAAGYAIDHWHQIAKRHQQMVHVDAPRVILYGSRSSSTFVLLKRDLDQFGIAYEARDLSDEANFHEVNEKLARIGKMGNSIPLPIAEVDGVMLEGADYPAIAKKLKTDGPR